jgi:hypothetical protein
MAASIEHNLGKPTHDTNFSFDLSKLQGHVQSCFFLHEGDEVVQLFTSAISFQTPLY